MTPSERRGALVVVLVLALGAARDLWISAHPVLVSAALAPTADPAREPRAEPQRSAAVSDTVRPLDLNRATASDLDALPGIGPVLAGRILEYRRRHGGFTRVEELLGVVGIGPRLMERLSRLVRVGPAAPP